MDGATKTKRSNPRISSKESPFIGLDQVLELVPVSRSALYLMIKSGEFPAQINLGERSVAWSRAEVNRWISNKLSRRAK